MYLGESPTYEKGITTVSPERMEELRAQVRAVYLNWNPDRMTMDYQPGDEMYTRLLLAEAGNPPLVRDDRAALEQRQAQGGGAAALVLAAAAAYLLL